MGLRLIVPRVLSIAPRRWFRILLLLLMLPPPLRVDGEVLSLGSDVYGIEIGAGCCQELF
jgi:hypothetical protein